MNYTDVQAPNTDCNPKLHKNDKLVLEIWLVNHNVVPGSTKMLTQEHVALIDIIVASQFAYLYYALKVCTLFVKKKYILLIM